MRKGDDEWCDWCNLRIAPREPEVHIPDPIDKQFHYQCYFKYVDDLDKQYERDYGHRMPVYPMKFVC